MRHTVQPVLFLAGAGVLLTLSRRFRLPADWLRLPASWGLAAAAWPAVMPAVRGDHWDLLMCLGATALCAGATAHTQRTRIAQLSPWWDRRLHHELRRSRPA